MAYLYHKNAKISTNFDKKVSGKNWKIQIIISKKV